MSPLPEPEAWPAEEPCAECAGTGEVLSAIRRTSSDEPREVKHESCPLCGRKPQVYILAVGIVAAVLAIAVAVVRVLDKRLEGMLAQVEARLDRRLNDFEARFTAHRAPCEWRFTRLGFPMHDVPPEEE